MPLKAKRVVVISDLHCGHEYGLVPPDWWSTPNSKSARVSKAARFQRQLWKFYSGQIDALKPIDVLILNGDAIEGKGERSGGKELLTTDRLEQIQMASAAIKIADAKHVRLTYGTKYHTGMDEDFEKILALDGGIRIHGHDFISVNGVNIDIKHKVGSSNIPHGRMTAIARARLWNVIWNSEQGRQPKSDILIRSHVHYFGYAGAASWLGITTPALTYNSEYGIRDCEGVVDVGFIVFDFDDRGGFTWRPILASFDKLQVRAESI